MTETINLSVAIKAAAKSYIKQQSSLTKALNQYNMDQSIFGLYLVGEFERRGVDLKQMIFEAGE